MIVIKFKTEHLSNGNDDFITHHQGKGKCFGKGVGDGNDDSITHYQGKGKCFGKGVGDGGGGAPNTPDIEAYEVKEI